jgi:Protein of unknown function (DUF4245)
MSESPEPVSPGGGRYQRSSGGLIGALLVTVGAVIAFAVFRGLTSDDAPTPVRAVDYSAAVEGARSDGKLVVLAPERLPLGWKATSATYTRGVSPTWHLGILTGETRYIGVEEARTSIQDLLDEHVDESAQRGQDVTIGEERWQTWTDSGGDYAVARVLEGPKGAQESVLVVGSAPPPLVRQLAGSLTGR